MRAFLSVCAPGRACMREGFGKTTCPLAGYHNASPSLPLDGYNQSYQALVSQNGCHWLYYLVSADWIISDHWWFPHMR